MATQNRLWGAEGIRGELLKLGLSVAKRTIQKYILRVCPPHARSQNRSTLLKNHAKDVSACDFLPVIDLVFRPIYAFFIIELASRRVVHFGVTRSPTDAWVAQQLREPTPLGEVPRFLIRDRDSKYGKAFTRVAVGTSIEVLKKPSCAPKANAVCERFLGGVRRECLDHILILGERHLDPVVQEYVEYSIEPGHTRGSGRGFRQDSPPLQKKRGEERSLHFRS